MSKVITLTLNDQEVADIGGWINYYDEHPQYIGVIPTPGVSPPDGQTKIVLEDQTRARYDELKAQFEPAPPQTGKPSVPPTLSIPGKATEWLELGPGEIGVTVAGFAGKTSVSCQDNVFVFVSTESTFPDDPNKTSAGAQASNYILVGAGQPYYYKHVSENPEYMRTSIELV